MSRYTEEYIFKYLDQTLTPEQTLELERDINGDSELKAVVEQLKTAHLYFAENPVESAPEQLSEKVMSRIDEMPKEYYQPSGLFSNTSFLLISGILTALVAFLSIIQGGFVDIQGMFPVLNEMEFLNQWSLETIISKRAMTNSMMVIYGVLALALLDRFVLNPFFKKYPKKLGFN